MVKQEAQVPTHQAITGFVMRPFFLASHQQRKCSLSPLPLVLGSIILYYSDRKIGMLTKVKMLQVTSDVCVGLEPFQRSGLNEVVLVQATNFTQQKQHLCLGVVLRSLFSLRSSTGVVFFLLSAFCACCARFQQVAQKENKIIIKSIYGYNIL